MTIRLAILLALGLAWSSLASAAERTPDLLLNGALTGAAHETYTEVPFKVPAGTVRLTVAFSYSGKAERSVIDLGLRDPQRFRGWSGGNKDRFVLEAADATPSYLAGPLPPGTWRLVLGAPNIRRNATAAYEARIWFDRADAPFPGFAPAPLKAGPGWYRGDLHLHTGHSDGSCLSHRGVKVPCPVFKTLEAAVARGLDFIAVTDHNATSQNEALRELAPYFDDLLLIPGREVTTFHGHANVFGPTGPLDFQLGGPRAPGFDHILDEVEAAGALISVNHPALPSGEACMGCGWTVKDTDWSRVQAMEVANGGSVALFGAEGGFSGIGVWEARLNAGLRITAIGGSDNHDPTEGVGKPGGVGGPTTVVHAANLSQAAILDAIRQGHVFVDVWGAGRLLEVEAQAGTARAEMGDLLPAASGVQVRLEVHVAGAPEGARLSLAGDSARVGATGEVRLGAAEAHRSFELTADGAAHWVRVDLRDAAGKLLVLGNPIYLRPAP